MGRIQNLNKESDTKLDLRAAWEAELQKQFGVDPNTDWEFLDFLWEAVARDYAPEIKEGADNVLESMVATAEVASVAHVRFPRGGGGNGKAQGRTSQNDLGEQIKFDPKTKTHVKALSEYLSKIAAVERRVMEFRRRHLGGTTATVMPAEVPRLLKLWSVAPGAEKEDDVSLYWMGERRPTMFRGRYWSAIGTLDRLGNYLAKKYPWNKDQALHFVLCGGVWQVKTVSGKPTISSGKGPAAHRFNRCTISLEVEAWIPPELVKKAYARIQREARERDWGLVGGATTTRRSYGRNAEVFRFVVGRSEIVVVSEKENLGKLVLSDSWRKLRELWDDHLPAGHAWRYGKNGWRNFHRDFMRGQKAAIGTEWGLPGYPGQPVTYAETQEAWPIFVENLTAQVKRSRKEES